MCTIVIPSAISRATSTTAAALVRIALPSGPPTCQRRPTGARRGLFSETEVVAMAPGSSAGGGSERRACPNDDHAGERHVE